jgi:hypothetical protein
VHTGECAKIIQKIFGRLLTLSFLFRRLEGYLIGTYWVNDEEPNGALLIENKHFFSRKWCHYEY